MLTDPQARALFGAVFRDWLQGQLEAPLPGVRRALRRRSYDDAGPIGRLEKAAWTLAEWRDFTAPWAPGDFDQAGRVDALVGELFAFARLTGRRRQGRRPGRQHRGGAGAGVGGASCRSRSGRATTTGSSPSWSDSSRASSPSRVPAAGPRRTPRACRGSRFSTRTRRSWPASRRSSATPTRISRPGSTTSWSARSMPTRSPRRAPARSTSSISWCAPAISCATAKRCAPRSSRASRTCSSTSSRTPIRCRPRSCCCSSPTIRARPTGVRCGRRRASCSWSAIRSSRSTASAAPTSASTRRCASSCAGTARPASRCAAASGPCPRSSTP